MTVARLDAEGLHPLRKAAYISLSDLTAADGFLYYGSIRSGRDEVYCYDLLGLHEYRLSQSRYGAFEPSQGAYGVLLTTYDRLGYRVAQLDQPLMERVGEQRLPDNEVNPERRAWSTINLDTVRFTERVAAAQAKQSPARRFRQVLRMPHIHSWAPVAFDPYQVIDEHEIDLNLGATLLSQNLLSNTEVYDARYAYLSEQTSVGVYVSRIVGRVSVVAVGGRSAAG